MNQQIIEEIREWMESFVEKSNPKFGKNFGHADHVLKTQLYTPVAK